MFEHFQKVHIFIYYISKLHNLYIFIYFVYFVYFGAIVPWCYRGEAFFEDYIRTSALAGACLQDDFELLAKELTRYLEC